MPVRHLRRLRRTARSFTRSERGAIAVEVALAGPLLVLSVLGLAETSLSVSDQQRLQAGAVAGAHYLHDVVDREDGTLFNKVWVSGETSGWQEGQAMKTVREIIRDASNLDLADKDINVRFDCGCLQVTPTTFSDEIDLEPTGPTQSDVSFTRVSEGVSVNSDATCSVTCADGSTASMLAEIRLDYVSSTLRGSDVARSHDLTLRLG